MEQDHPPRPLTADHFHRCVADVQEFAARLLDNEAGPEITLDQGAAHMAGAHHCHLVAAVSLLAALYEECDATPTSIRWGALKNSLSLEDTCPPT